MTRAQEWADLLALEPPEALRARVEGVTRAQVAACAQKLALDTVYCLTGKED